MSQDPMNEDPAEVEAILRSLAPAPSRLDFSEAMYLAGRASVVDSSRPRGPRRLAWLWPLATGVSLLSTATLAILWNSAGTPEVIERVVYVERQGTPVVAAPPAPVASPAIDPPGPWQEYARLCRVVSAEGVEKLPEIQWRSGPDSTSPAWDDLDNPVLRRAPGG
jgi:hypothetical protein